MLSILLNDIIQTISLCVQCFLHSVCIPQVYLFSLRSVGMRTLSRFRYDTCISISIRIRSKELIPNVMFVSNGYTAAAFAAIRGPYMNSLCCCLYFCSADSVAFPNNYNSFLCFLFFYQPTTS